jgi:ribonucleoside-diphosphate reductase alpha chain
VHGRPDQATQAEMAERYGEYFPAYVAAGIKAELLDGARPL